ncbi:CU044_2847 family protein [Streptomyces sp. NPDC059373]
MQLPGGADVLARVTVLDEYETAGVDREYGEYEDVSVLDAVAARVEGLKDLVTGVGEALHRAARAAAPDEVSATFGIEIGLKSGVALALLADGEAKTSIEVTLTWRDRLRAPVPQEPPSELEQTPAPGPLADPALNA